MANARRQESPEDYGFSYVEPEHGSSREETPESYGFSYTDSKPSAEQANRIPYLGGSNYTTESPENILKGSKALVKSIANQAIGLADLLPGVNIKRLPQGNSASEIAADIGGGLLGYGKATSALKAIGLIPHTSSATLRAARTIAGGGLAGAVNRPEEQAHGVAEGSLFNAVGHGAGGLLGNISHYLSPKARALQNIFQNVKPSNLKDIADSEKLLGVELSPLERSAKISAGGNAIRNNILKSIQEDVEKSTQTYPMMQARESERLGQEKKAINSLLENISPEEKHVSADLNAAAEETRDTAARIIDKLRAKRSAASDPLYAIADAKRTPEYAQIALRNDPVLSKRHRDVLSDETNYYDLKGYDIDSIKVIDLMRKQINGEIKALQESKGNENEIRKLNQQRSALDNIYEGTDDDIRKARAAYATHSIPVNRMENSIIGDISRMENGDFHGIAKKIFDREKTNAEEFKFIKSEIQKENPEAWNHLFRQDVERKIDSITTTGVGGRNFYNKLLKNDNDFNRLMIGAEGIPGAQAKLVAMRSVFSRILSPANVRLAKREKPLANKIPLNKYQIVHKSIGFLDNTVYGRYNKEVAKILTDPKWDKKVSELSKIKDNQKLIQKWGDLAGLVANEGLNREGGI